MNSVEIIVAAFSKAIAGGWNQQLLEDPWTIHESRLPGRFELCVPRLTEQTKTHLDVLAVCFSHDFAEALWGNDYVTSDHLVDGLEAWKFHLMHMVVDPDPVKYLGENT